MAPSHPIRRLARFAGNALVVLTILACAAWIAPSLFGYERYVITGGSMSGTFEKGSLAFEKRVPVADLAKGDVITYLPPPDSGVTNLVTHRIRGIEPGEDGALVYTTKGDANPEADPWHFQLAEPTQPVVQQVVPLLGYVFIALADRGTRMLLIGGPAALVALLALAELVRGIRDRGSATQADPAAAPVPAAGALPHTAPGIPEQPTSKVERPRPVPARA